MTMSDTAPPSFRSASVAAARTWWAPREYGWLRAYLTPLGLAGWARFVVAVGGLVIGVSALLAAIGPPDLLRHNGKLVMFALAAGGLAWTLRWMLGPWPTRAESVGLLAAADIAGSRRHASFTST